MDLETLLGFTPGRLAWRVSKIKFYPAIVGFGAPPLRGLLGVLLVLAPWTENTVCLRLRLALSNVVTVVLCSPRPPYFHKAP